MKLFTEIPALDNILLSHAAALAGDLDGYRNHTYRVANLCVALSADGARRLDAIAIAAAFHDMGIWTDRTFDYLEPSVRLASAHLKGTDREPWIPDITAMILEHHKITPLDRDSPSLVEPFRRADWIDVSRGLVTFGLSRAFVAELFSVWPSAGFHWRLVQLTFGRLRTHPLRPLPMMRF